MNKQNQAIKPLLKSLMLSSCAMFAFATSAVHAQTDAGAATAISAAGVNSLPTITNVKPDDRNQAQLMSETPFSGRPAVAVPQPKSAFETYVQSATGANLKVFGRNLFSKVPDTFAPTKAVQVNPDYVIGSGDGLQIRGWGMVSIDLNVIVDRSGAIYIPKVGTVRVAGVKYRDLQNYLKSAIGKNFSNFDLTVSISQTRAVQIYVVGHAVRPGTYTLSAMSTLLNALFTSGGPDGTGTMRNIELKRGNQTIATLDLYDMLLKGDKSHDVSLQDGDVIYIPQVGPLVALTGNVKNAAIFELKNDTSLADVIGWAGGFDSSTDLKQVILQKSVNNRYETVATLRADTGDVAAQLSTIRVQPADILRVFSPSSIPVQVQVPDEYVRVAGEVKHSGVFKITHGETLREFLSRIGGIRDDGYVYAMQLDRESVRQAQQAKLDEIADRFEREVDSNAKHRLAGTTDPSNIAAVTAEVERQHELAKRMRSVRAKGRIVLELQGDDAEIKNLPDIPLQDGDDIYVPRKPGTINVFGSVFQQSAFIYKPRRTVRDYLALAGGPTATADPSEIYLLRADGTAESERGNGWLSGLKGAAVNPGDTIVVPEKIDRNSFTQNLREWTSILYQFGLGAAGLKVLKD